MNRRTFLKTGTLLGATWLLNPLDVLSLDATRGKNKSHKLKATPATRISKVDKPLAIAMWDFSWILRHHKYGSFENWEEVIAGLAERGYNAIRMDAMPQFVVSEKDGTIIDEFRSPVKSWNPVLWGNQYTMSFRPREALLEFLPLCKKYGIQVGLSSWFSPHGIKRDIFTEEGGALRAWTETLDFLKENGLLDENIIYVDLLNEYPVNHGFDWLKIEMNKCSDTEEFMINNPQAHMPQKMSNDENVRELRKMVYNNFSKDLCGTLAQRYPELDFFVSYDQAMEDIDLTNQKALDFHMWFSHTGKLPSVKEIGEADLNYDWKVLQANLDKYWQENRQELIDWMDARITSVAKMARENGVVCGNTEGWGAVCWMDHPDLSWDFIKESAEIAVNLCKKHPEYKFICTSNFTHPHFKGMWNDIEWHRKITSIIKS